MDNKTLALTYIIVAVAVFLTSLTIAIYHKEQYFKIFAFSFLASAVGGLLIAGQGIIYIGLSLILGNIIMLLSYLLLVSGFRAFYNELIIWPKHFWIDLIVCFFAFVYATFVHDSFILRIIVYTIFLVIIMTELYVYLRTKLAKIPRLIRNGFQITIFGYMGIYIVRLILILIKTGDSCTLIKNDKFSGLALMASIVSLIFWVSALQLLDSFKLLEEMREKNNLLDLMAQTDKLTGIYNRHYLDLNIDEYMEISDRLGKPMVFILLDLDHFKEVNDRYGHAVGDDVLVCTVNRIKDTIRTTDKVIRWGGEEFLILALGTSQEDAVKLAEKLRNAIASKLYDTAGHVTSSFGVAERFYSETQDMCFKRVDLALYRAKNSGRNCVVTWNSSDQLPIALVKVEWIEKWNSGNDVIDNDHRILVELSNKLIESTFLEISVDVVKEQIDQIVSHIVHHFEQEEQILKRIAYPEVAEHMQSHKDLVAEIGVIIENYRNGKSNITDLISFLVGKVVIGHMLMMDTKFFLYTKAEKQDPHK